MSSVLKQSITPKELNALAEKNKRKIMKTLNTKGYVENLWCQRSFVKLKRNVCNFLMMVWLTGLNAKSRRYRYGV